MQGNSFLETVSNFENHLPRAKNIQKIKKIKRSKHERNVKAQKMHDNSTMKKMSLACLKSIQKINLYAHLQQGR